MRTNKFAGNLYIFKELKKKGYILFFVITFSVGINRTVYGQSDSLSILPKTLIDSVGKKIADSTSQQKKGDIETTITYSAKDSIIFLMGTKKLLLYGKGKVTYGKINLESEEIEIDYTKNELSAQGKTDSLGKAIGNPVFTENTDKYTAQRMRYNYKTRRGKIRGIITQQGEGFIHGENVKKNASDELFIKHAKYTTCNLAEPHFYFAVTRVKLIPNKRVIAGPFNLNINGIPTPIGFPFGYFPLPKDNTSGIVSFKFGETALNGFFIGEGGYYWHISDHLDMKVTGDLFTLGGYRANFESNYSKRYAFNGHITFGLSNKINGVGNGTGNSFTWTHIPTPKGLSSFSANVNISSFDFNRNNSTNLNDFINPQFSSNVSFRTGIRNTPITMGINLRHNQNVTKRSMELTLPEFSLNVGNVYLFKKALNAGNSWYENLSVNYNFEGKYIISNNDFANPADNTTRLPFTSENLDLFIKNAKTGAKHDARLQTNFKALNYLSVTPGFNYTEFWYPSQLVHNYNSTSEKPELIDTLKKFSRGYTYTTSVAFSTTIFGTVKFRGRLQGIRHTLIPNISINYNPDFSKKGFGSYNELIYTNSNGETKNINQPKFNGYLYGGPGAGRSGSININLNNTLEIKVKTKNDTTQKFKKIKIFDNLTASTNYNLLADSMNLSTISLSTSKTVGKFNFNVTSVLDPYLYEKTDTSSKTLPIRTRKYSLNENGSIGKITNATLSIGANLNPFLKKKNGNKTNTPSNTLNYIDWNIPWNLSLNYNLTYTYLTTATKSKFDGNTVMINGNVSISPKWKIDIRTSFNIKTKTLTDDTRLMLVRDLHCWELAMEWIPFGIRASYSVQLRVKASILRDLKLEKNRSWLYN